MVRLRNVDIAVLFVIADMALGKFGNDTNNNTNLITDEVKKKGLFDVGARRKGHRSTSSSSGEKAGGKGTGDSGESMEISDDSSTDSAENPKKKNAFVPMSSLERRGWRKWHRKCPPCREDMEKKWRDPSIGWICGAYQRARRSFKSLCMMHYRNCQDGTMFTKIHDHRCENDTKRYGEHFFYDYVAVLSDDTSRTSDSKSTEEHLISSA